MHQSFSSFESFSLLLRHIHITSDGIYCFSLYQASFLLSANDHGNQDKYELSHMVNKYQLLVYFADSLFDDTQYKRAEVCLSLTD